MTDLLSFAISLEGNTGVQSAVLAFFAYVFMVHLALIFWAARDSVARTKNVFFQVFAILLVATLSLFGVVLYVLVRPIKTLEDRLLDDMEQKLLMEAWEKHKAAAAEEAPEAASEKKEGKGKKKSA